MKTEIILEAYKFHAWFKKRPKIIIGSETIKTCGLFDGASIMDCPMSNLNCTGFNIIQGDFMFGYYFEAEA